VNWEKGMKKSDRFLSLFAQKLKDDFWGVIEPSWFLPENADPDGCEDEKWAADLQKLVEDIFEEIENTKV